MAVIDDIKKTLSVKFKTRHDTFTDQFTRIFMVKLMMVGSLLIGLNWFNDSIACIVPKSLDLDQKYVSAACWINGFYVYEEVRNRTDDVAYFGLPRNIQHDGRMENGELCSTSNVVNQKMKGCTPMHRTFFLQYQYLVFVVASLAMLYYSPYILFKVTSTDLISLKTVVKKGEADSIVDNYFDYKINSRRKMRLRTVMTIVVKVLYILANVTAFLLINNIVNGRFINYGIQWVKWAKYDNELAYNYVGVRESPKPGNALLPSFGYCEVHEASQDIKHVITNKHKFVCEISQHILYQYVLIVLWFAMLFGISVSTIGLLIHVLDLLWTVLCFCTSNDSMRVYDHLTLRECEYLAYIRDKNLSLFGEIIRKLLEKRLPRENKDYDDNIPRHHQDPQKIPILQNRPRNTSDVKNTPNGMEQAFYLHTPSL